MSPFAQDERGLPLVDWSQTSPEGAPEWMSFKAANGQYLCAEEGGGREEAAAVPLDGGQHRG